MLGGLRAAAFACLAALLLAGGHTAPARAQEGAAPPADRPTAENLQSLIDTIEDEGRRKELLEQLRALLAAQKEMEGRPDGAEEAGFLGPIERHVENFGAAVSSAATMIFESPSVWPWLHRQATEPAARQLWLSIAANLALVFAAAFAADLLLRLALRRPRRAVETRNADTLLMRVPLLLLRTLLDLLPIAAFAAAAYLVLGLREPEAAVRDVILTLVNAGVLARVVFVAGRLMFAPRVSAMRVLPLADETAHYLYIWLRRFTNVGVYGFFALEAGRRLGLPRDTYGVLGNFLGLVLAGMAVVLIWQNRRTLGDRLRAEPAAGAAAGWRGVGSRFADIWHVFAVAYVVAAYVVWALDVQGGFLFLVRASLLTVVIAVAAHLAARLLRRLVDRIFHIAEEVKAVYPGIEVRANRYVPMLQKVLAFAVYVIAAVAILQAWGVNAFGWVTSDIGREAIGRAASIVLILVVALAVWEISSAMIARYLERMNEGDSPRARYQRVRTLLPLARKSLLVVLIVMVSLIVLAELGINIAPLLAGAGVAGLAIGFGAQTLVKDVITGLFNLVEDTVAVGDIVSLAGHAGVVEGISIRSVQLRGYDGNVHVIPFSEVTTVENFTRGYSHAVFDIGVAYRENVDEVIEVMREVAAGMREDPEYKPVILEDLEVAGLEAFADSAVIIRARLKVLPAQQWAVRREYNRRIKAAFDERGIEIPFPHTTVYFGEDRAGWAPAARIHLEREAADAAAAGERPKEPPKPATAEKKPRPERREKTRKPTDGGGASPDSGDR